MLPGIVFININGVRWRDAAPAHGPHETLCNRWKRWGEKGLCARMMVALAASHGAEKAAMIDATFLEAHRTASGPGLEKGSGAA